jgi:hypothetical protein
MNRSGWWVSPVSRHPPVYICKQADGPGLVDASKPS